VFGGSIQRGADVLVELIVSAEGVRCHRSSGGDRGPWRPRTGSSRASWNRGERGVALLAGLRWPSDGRHAAVMASRWDPVEMSVRAEFPATASTAGVGAAELTLVSFMSAVAGVRFISGTKRN
jgi:hypothetical protein